MFGGVSDDGLRSLAKMQKSSSIISHCTDAKHEAVVSRYVSRATLMQCPTAARGNIPSAAAVPASWQLELRMAMILA